MPARELKEPSHEQIAQRAYFHWLREGSPSSRDKQNWYFAETELMQQQLGEKGIVWARETADLRRGLAQINAKQ